MSIYRKVKSVEKVFSKLQQETDDFRKNSQLACKSGCGKCCFKADIEATILEFLPFAYHLYKSGLAIDWQQKLSVESSDICVILNPFLNGQGQCSSYPYRGLICRLFGFSARRNKYGTTELVTCNIIKTEQEVAYNKALASVSKQEMQIPMIHQYYTRLNSIDANLTRDFYPINTAIKKAIEEVLHYYAYRPGTYFKSA
jgi:uncharacterized protein